MAKTKINILSINTRLGFGGDETRLLNQCKLMDKDIFRLIACVPAGFKSAGIISHYHAAGIEVRFIDEFLNINKAKKSLIKLAMLLNLFAFNLRLLQIIYKEKIHILDGRLLSGGFYGVLLKILTRLPVVTTIYHTSNDGIFHKVARYFLRFSNVIICDSSIRTEEIKHWIGSKRPEFYIIPSPIKLNFSDDDSLRLIKQQKSDLSKVIIGQIAGIISYKGQDILIDAFAQIANKYKNTELWIVGIIRNEKFFQLLKDQVVKHDLQDRVTFLSYPGYIGNIFEILDIQVHASRFDSLPNSILEGMSVGKPLIASEVGGIPDMVIHNKTGLVFNPNDTNCLGDYLDRFVSDDLYRNQLGLAAKERFDQYYSPDFLSLQIENIFKDLYTKHFN